jgi:hypothetical protein
MVSIPICTSRLHNRGLAHHDKGDLDGALADYTEAIRLKPDLRHGLLHRAQVRKTMVSATWP